VTDAIAWGVGGQLAGSILGFLGAEVHNRRTQQNSVDVVWVAARAALRAASFAVTVALVGHVMVAILY
jgi:hypothetical protein